MNHKFMHDRENAELWAFFKSYVVIDVKFVVMEIIIEKCNFDNHRMPYHNFFKSVAVMVLRCS